MIINSVNGIVRIVCFVHDMCFIHISYPITITGGICSVMFLTIVIMMVYIVCIYVYM